MNGCTQWVHCKRLMEIDEEKSSRFFRAANLVWHYLQGMGLGEPLETAEMLNDDIESGPSQVRLSAQASNSLQKSEISEIDADRESVTGSSDSAR